MVRPAQSDCCAVSSPGEVAISIPTRTACAASREVWRCSRSILLAPPPRLAMRSWQQHIQGRSDALPALRAAGSRRCGSVVTRQHHLRGHPQSGQRSRPRALVALGGISAPTRRPTLGRFNAATESVTIVRPCCWKRDGRKGCTRPPGLRVTAPVQSVHPLGDRPGTRDKPHARGSTQHTIRRPAALEHLVDLGRFVLVA